MIVYEGGKRKYYDRNGKEITEGSKVRYMNSKRSQDVYKVYRTSEDELGVDATNPKWIESGRAVPCEYGIFPFSYAETEMIEVVEE